MSQRTRTRTVAARRLTRCERGADCPFRHEHQHTSEYSHEDAPKPKPKLPVGKGRKLGGGRTPAVGDQRQVVADAVVKRLKLSTTTSTIDLTKD